MFDQEIPVVYTGPLLIHFGSKKFGIINEANIQDLSFKVSIPQFKASFGVYLEGLNLGCLVFEEYQFRPLEDVISEKKAKEFKGNFELLKNLAKDNLIDSVFLLGWWGVEANLTGQQILDLLALD